MNKSPTLGWQSWSPPFPAWHGFPRWDYSPFPLRKIPTSKIKSSFKEPIRYWCSWYAYGWDINNRKITQTLQFIKKNRLNFTHILIDDGWTSWGDWSDPNLARFPNMGNTIQAIHNNGLKAGLWFAPFLASKNSQLFQVHPDWFINYQDKPVQGLKTMPIWEWFLPQQYLLDLSHPKVKKYLTDFIDLAVKKWKIDLLKLDFLYAPYFNPHLNSDQVAHDQVSWILDYIKDNYPAVVTVACGTPFSPSSNRATAIRISKDTALPPLVPKLFNQIVYVDRVKMLAHKLIAATRYPNIIVDPDVRIFRLDTPTTNKIWSANKFLVTGIGDNLIKLDNLKIKELKYWLDRK